MRIGPETEQCRLTLAATSDNGRGPTLEWGESGDYGTAGSWCGKERQVMGIPQVPEHFRRAPLVALRAVFTGIGRALMVADRPAPAAPPAASGGASATTPPGANAGISATEVAQETKSVEAQGAVDLPLLNYDALSLASIRARLRGLDVAQLKVLLDYEAGNAERTEVLGMFERRIEKLEAGA